MILKHYNLAFITGANSGLGKALAILLASKGIPLFLTARSEEKLEEVARQLRSQVSVTCHHADLSDPLSRQSLLKRLQELSPDLIINNAGFGLYGDALDYSTEEQVEILEVNAKALMEISLEGARALIQAKKKGTILNISSAAAFFAFPSFSVYAASKAFVNSFSQSLDGELSSKGVRVLCACPGQINTPFSVRASQGNFQKKRRFVISVEKAASLLYAQVEKERSLTIFDWRYRLGVFFGRFFIPKKLLTKSLRSSIRVRQKLGT